MTISLIQVRRGTTEEWSAEDPVLAEGEPSYDVTTGDFKVGDGTSVWTALPGVSSFAVATALQGAQAAQAAAEDAAQRAESVGATTDAQVAQALADSSSQTRAVSDAQYVRQNAQRWDVRAHDVPTDGTAAADDQLDTLLGLMAPGDELYVPSGAVVRVSRRHDITRPVTIQARGATFVQDSPTGVFRVLAGGSGSRFYGLRGVGPSGTSYASTSRLLLLAGSATAYVNDIVVEDVTGEQWGNGTLEAQFARRVITRDVLTKNCVYMGQMFLSCEDLTLHNPMCDGLQGLSNNSNSYPVAFTRASLASLVDAPRTKRAKVYGGYARNTTWESLDTHGGQDIKIFGYTDSNTRLGVSFVGSADENGTVVYAPLDCWAFGCTSESGVSDGTSGDGFVIAGALNREYATGGLIGCASIGRGTAASSAGSGGVRLQATSGVQVMAYRGVECSPHSVALGSQNYDTVLSGIVGVDPWGATAGTGVVGIAGGDNTLTLGSARLVRGTKQATNVARAGVRANSSALTNIAITLAGGNDFSVASDGPYVSATAFLRQSQFGNPVARQSVANNADTATLIAALKAGGLIA